jgi:hypothetical protein
MIGAVKSMQADHDVELLSDPVRFGGRKIDAVGFMHTAARSVNSAYREKSDNLQFTGRAGCYGSPDQKAGSPGRSKPTS